MLFDDRSCGRTAWREGWPDERHVRALDEARAFLADHWSPATPRRDWQALVVDGGWAALRWPPDSFGRALDEAEAREVEAEFAAAHAPGPGQDITNLWAGTIVGLRPATS